jgi:Breast carcinoma amplified sequence 2 (BCAS2)
MCDIRLSQVLSVFSQNNPLLAAELRRVEARQPLTAIDTSRYQLTLSSSTPSTDEEWKSALDGAYAQLEHQRIRYRLVSHSLVSKLYLHSRIKAQQSCTASTIRQQRMAYTQLLAGSRREKSGETLGGSERTDNQPKPREEKQSGARSRALYVIRA